MTQWTNDPGSAPPSSPPRHGSEWDGSPPPPLYPPLRQFPGANAPQGPTHRSGRMRTLIVAVAVGLVLAAVGFGLGRSLQDDGADGSDARPPTTTVAVGRQANASATTTAGATAEEKTADQAGPVTDAPSLDPGLADEPAAAVNKAVSPAVVQIDTQQGLGTGFVYDANGYILTAAHVVSSVGVNGQLSSDFERQVAVRLADGSSVQGEVLGADPNNDVAVVKIDPIEGMPVAALALGERPEVGSIAVAIGSPFGLDQTVTQGIVSAVNRPVPSPNNNIVSMIQTDAAINSGNSGGPLVNREGKVIGINTQIRTDSGDNAGIGFAVPIDLAYDVAQQLVRGEPIQLGYLGVQGADPGFGTAGAMLETVAEGSPAAAAGLQQGDVVTEANGQAIRSFEELASVIRATSPGERLSLKVERDGATIDVEVTVGRATTR